MEQFIFKRLPSFKEYFIERLKENDMEGDNQVIMNNERDVFFSYTKQSENVYKLSHLSYGEDGHDNIFYSCTTFGSILYNLSTDTFDKNIYLSGKPRDGANGWFTHKLSYFWEIVPKTAFKRGIDKMNGVYKMRLVKRFCDNLLERWYTPNAEGVAPYALWTFKKFQEECAVEKLIISKAFTGFI